MVQNIILLLSLVLFTLSCNKNESINASPNILVALPTPPVKVKNTNGEWVVYEMHIKAPSLNKVSIFNANTLQLNYSDFNTRENLHIASIWLPFPNQGWQENSMEHVFEYIDNQGNTKHHTFNLKIENEYPEPISINFPVPQGVWLAEGAPGATSYHTRAIFPYPDPLFDSTQQGYLIGNNPQRYAIDYALLVDGLPYDSDGSALEDWYCYNLPILAAKGGKVIFTEDGIPDNQTPFQLDYPTDINNATGNVVYIEHDDGTIGTYCHMIPNSLLVEVGDIVSAGQEIGRLGNSGNSFAPHLHMHVLINPEHKQLTKYADGLFMESMPYTFSDFIKLGNLPPGYLDENPITPFVPTTSEVFTNVIPSESDVIAF